MIGFDYTYKHPDEIYSSFISLNVIAPSEVITLLLWAIFTVVCIFFILPSIIISYELQQSIRMKKNKKKLLKQILIQKEIEDEIEQQIQIEEEYKVV